MESTAIARAVPSDDAGTGEAPVAVSPRSGRLPSLSAAIRAARLEVADRAQALGDLHDAELARLELLRELIAPVLAQIPPEIDLFDTGLVPGEHPRLFIDMVAFVEMGRDRRTYRLVQDRRQGRAVLHESEGVNAAVAAVTTYIARRLVEREQFLASLDCHPLPPAAAPAPAGPAPSASAPRRRRVRGLRRLLRALSLVVDGLGLAALGALLWLGLHLARGHMPNW